jgi:aspartyl protease family protein
MPEDPDSWARLFYLVMLGAFLASFFLFGQRQKMSHTLQQAAIWGMIFVFVIIAYGFKDILKSQLFPGDPVAYGESLELRRSADGHFYANALVNGQPVEFVVDTGASQIVLSQEDARSVGINPDALNYVGRAYTANGEVSTAPVRLDLLEFGNYRDTNVAASVNGGQLSGSLLGMSYLGQYRIEIDGKRMILTR